MKAVDEQHLKMVNRRLPHSSILHPDPQPLSQLDHHTGQPPRTAAEQQQHVLPHRQSLQQQQQQLQHDHYGLNGRVSRTSAETQQHALQHQQSQQQQQLHDHSHLDTAFYAIHLLMSAVHKRLLVTSREQLGFEAAMSIFAAALLMRLFFKPFYTRVRPQLVFIVHVLLTIIRASVVYTMASKQAVHLRVGMFAEDKHTAGVFVTTMLAILGGPFRLFEMMGLQQPWTAHALISVLYLAIHPLGAASAIRLACSNAMFYQVHTVHDAVSAMVDMLLDTVTGMPLGQQQTCSSCAGVAIYGFMCLFASVCVPLYLMYVYEQGVHRRCLQQAGTAGTGAPTPPVPAAASHVPAGHSSSHAAVGTQPQPAAAVQQDQQLARDRERLAAGGWGQHGASNGMSGAAPHTTPISHGDADAGAPVYITRLEAICLKAEAVAAEQRQDTMHLPSLRDLVTSSNVLVRWGTHLVVLLMLMVLCWLVAVGFALSVLPRVLSSHELDRWCPNRPFTPYVMAGEVYEGL